LFFFSSRRRHTSFSRDWSSDVCSSDLRRGVPLRLGAAETELRAGDRLLVAASAASLARAKSSSESALEALLAELGLERISAMEEIGRASCRERGEGVDLAVPVQECKIN